MGQSCKHSSSRAIRLHLLIDCAYKLNSASKISHDTNVKTSPNFEFHLLFGNRLCEEGCPDGGFLQTPQKLKSVLSVTTSDSITSDDSTPSTFVVSRSHKKRDCRPNPPPPRESETGSPDSRNSDLARNVEPSWSSPTPFLQAKQAWLV